MRPLIQISVAVLGTACLLVGAAGLAEAQGQNGRGQMERCVDRVLGGLARSKAPEEQAGPAVVTQCNAPLRAAVAEAIRTGEAFICSNVDACLPMAQERASYEARDAYRRLLQR
jgi:hypothetical protein